MFFDIGMLSQTLIQQYETILEGNIWDVKVSSVIVSSPEPLGSHLIR